MTRKEIRAAKATAITVALIGVFCLAMFVAAKLVGFDVVVFGFLFLVIAALMVGFIFASFLGEFSKSPLNEPPSQFERMGDDEY